MTCVFIVFDVPSMSQPRSHQQRLTPSDTHTHIHRRHLRLDLCFIAAASSAVGCFPFSHALLLPPVRIPSSSCCAASFPAQDGGPVRLSSAPCSGACTPRQERPTISLTSSFVVLPWQRSPPRAASSKRRMTGSKHRRGHLEGKTRLPLPSLPYMAVGLMSA